VGIILTMGIIFLMVEILGGQYLNGKQGFSCWKKCLFLVVDVRRKLIAMRHEA
jgi:hypothetical protein